MNYYQKNREQRLTYQKNYYRENKEEKYKNRHRQHIKKNDVLKMMKENKEIILTF